MLRKPEATDIILALSNLIGAAPLKPSKKNWNLVKSKCKTDGEFIKLYLDDVQNRITWVQCPQCKRTWNALAAQGICITCVDIATEQERMQTVNGTYLMKVLGKWGLEHYRFSSFTITETNEEAYNACQAFDSTKENIYLFGPCGTGKTHLAGSILKTAAAEGKSLKWVTPIYLGRGLRGRWPGDEREFISEVGSHDILVIDDLGVGRDSYAILQCVYEILEDRRMRNQAGLIITSNWSPPQLSKKYDDRLVSRLMGMCRVIEMGGHDSRLATPTQTAKPKAVQTEFPKSY